MKSTDADRAFLTRFAWLSIATALATIALKMLAFWLTGSIGLLSDALESIVNLAGGIIGLVALTVAARMPDEERPFGYDKAEYFASGAEGALILAAAFGIAIAAVERLLHPRPIGQVSIGIAVSVIASSCNLLTARILLRAGRQHQSITLESDARHLMTDVWTSVGVIAGVGAVMATGWHWLDPVIAIIVAANILRIGARLLQRSIGGLMDTALPADERAQVMAALDALRALGVEHHALRTRAAASRRFIAVHLLVPGDWTVHRGHEVAEQFERTIHRLWDRAALLVHVEPIEDVRSYEDRELSRKRAALRSDGVSGT